MGMSASFQSVAKLIVPSNLSFQALRRYAILLVHLKCQTRALSPLPTKSICLLFFAETSQVLFLRLLFFVKTSQFLFLLVF